MKPRVFVSSTFYDLKYVRDDLSNFIRIHDFEPIMFDDGDIVYTPDKRLDSSCYAAMRSADMCILIIGGNYCNPSTSIDPSCTDDFISITRQEFKAAHEEGMPIFVFIDNKVYIEYEVFEKNYVAISNGASIAFSATNNIGIFSLIRDIKKLAMPITPFEKTFHIKHALSSQWSDMFTDYLSTLRERNSVETLHSSVAEMNRLVETMQVMLDSYGKPTVKNDVNNSIDDYAPLVEEQEHMKIASICEEISHNIVISLKNKTEFTNPSVACEKFYISIRSLLTNNITQYTSNISMYSTGEISNDNMYQDESGNTKLNKILFENKDLILNEKYKPIFIFELSKPNVYSQLFSYAPF